MANFVKDAIGVYFHLGYSQDEMLISLANHCGLVISKRSLQRYLKSMRLYRKKHFSDVLDVTLFILQETFNIDLQGYRLVHLKCIQAGYVVTQQTVRLIMHILCPEGIERRIRHRLRRRRYTSKGPNYMWHIDSYDKLKPYGLCINGCIDGFSRKIIWLEVYYTSSDPKVVASYYLDALSHLGGYPCRIRADFGTENRHIEQMHKFLRFEDTDELAHHCFLYGSSTHNQRIEQWWSFLRKSLTHFWILTFHDMKEADLFTGSDVDKMLIQFCFMKFIQNQLDDLVTVWNAHLISKSRNANAPRGRPLVMYTCPELYGASDYISPMEADKMDICRTESIPKGSYPCDKDFFELCCIIMFEHGLSEPVTIDHALKNYSTIRDILKD